MSFEFKTVGPCWSSLLCRRPWARHALTRDEPKDICTGGYCWSDHSDCENGKHPTGTVRLRWRHPLCGTYCLTLSKPRLSQTFLGLIYVFFLSFFFFFGGGGMFFLNCVCSFFFFQLYFSIFFIIG